MTQPVTTPQVPTPLKTGVKKPMPAKHDTPHRTANAKAARMKEKNNG
jgi:hypothetical protein